jgi:hypothetical protein
LFPVFFALAILRRLGDAVGVNEVAPSRSAMVRPPLDRTDCPRDAPSFEEALENRLARELWWRLLGTNSRVRQVWRPRNSESGSTLQRVYSVVQDSG